MNPRHLFAGLAALSSLCSAQTINTYTETQTGSNLIALGFPVPRAVASLTPVDGYRDYASLDARLQSLDMTAVDLSGQEVGRTTAGRSIRAYVLSDPDPTDIEGRAEAAFFVNASTHAREWAAPEVSTYLIERMTAAANDGGLVRYLLDNSRLVIIPIQNVDGFLQTQRFPDQVIIGRDPRFPTFWPRDGRMRRKNMNGVDEVLTSFADHLLGVDLNRNHPPFWATSGGSSSNPSELVYHGTAVQSEPEVQAMLVAARLAPESRIRFGVDLHTFGAVFFSSNTARVRLNTIQTRLLGVMSSHHVSVPTSTGAINGRLYRDVPDPPNSGIGAAAEYFAYQWLVPAMTLELEPQNDATEYGGRAGVSHSGFILPNNQIRRVREAWAESFLVGFYYMAGSPHLSRLRLRDAVSGTLLQEQRWDYDSTTQRRALRIENPAPIRVGQRLRAEFAFSKPMRYRRNGIIEPLPGRTVDDLFVSVRMAAGSAEPIFLDTAQGIWSGREGRLRYDDDSYAFEFNTPTAAADLRLEIAALDMVGLQLDSNPATPVDWTEGAWSGLENSDGVVGDSGGTYRSATFTATLSSNPADAVVVAAPAVVGEGDLASLSLRLPAPATARIEIGIGATADFAATPATGARPATVVWEAGAAGERLLPFIVPDDVQVQVQGERQFALPLTDVSVGTAPRALAAINVRALDNDREGNVVVRAVNDLSAALALIGSSAAGIRELVLNGDRAFGYPQTPLGCIAAEFKAPLRVFGNRASLEPVDNPNCGDVAGAASGAGVVDLRDFAIVGAGGDGLAQVALLNSAEILELRRVRLGPNRLAGASAQPPALKRALLLNVAGATRADRLIAFDLGAGSAAVEVAAGSIALTDSTLLGASASSAQSALSLSWSTTLGGASSSALAIAAGATANFRGSLLQDSTPPFCLGGNVNSTGFNLLGDLACTVTHPDDIASGTVALTLDANFGGYPPGGPAIDAGGTDCPAVDQRGAPRPQTLSSGAAPRCDIGAIELGVNPYRGIWSPTRAGHGLDLQTSGNRLLVAWYTYDNGGEPTAYQAVAALVGPNWSADLLQARRDAQTGTISTTRVGRVGIDFRSDTAATLRWRFDARGIDGSEEIRANVFAVAEPRFEVTGLWYPPADSGYGASITRRAEITALGMYYYDAQGNLRWALGTGNGADAQIFQMASFTGFCPDCDAAANPVRSQPAGTVLTHFLTPERARIDVDLTYPGAAGGRWLRRNGAFVPLNDAVDNRWPLVSSAVFLAP